MGGVEWRYLKGGQAFQIPRPPSFSPLLSGTPSPHLLLSCLLSSLPLPHCLLCSTSSSLCPSFFSLLLTLFSLAPSSSLSSSSSSHSSSFSSLVLVSLLFPPPFLLFPPPTPQSLYLLLPGGGESCLIMYSACPVSSVQAFEIPKATICLLFSASPAAEPRGHECFISSCPVRRAWATRRYWMRDIFVNIKNHPLHIYPESPRPPQDPCGPHPHGLSSSIASGWMGSVECTGCQEPRKPTA